MVMAYGDSKDLNRITDPDKALRVRHLNLKIQNMMDINVYLFQWLINELPMEKLKMKLFVIKK